MPALLRSRMTRSGRDDRGRDFPRPAGARPREPLRVAGPADIPRLQREAARLCAAAGFGTNELLDVAVGIHEISRYLLALGAAHAVRLRGGERGGERWLELEFQGASACGEAVAPLPARPDSVAAALGGYRGLFDRFLVAPGGAGGSRLYAAKRARRAGAPFRWVV